MVMVGSGGVATGLPTAAPGPLTTFTSANYLHLLFISEKSNKAKIQWQYDVTTGLEQEVYQCRMRKPGGRELLRSKVTIWPAYTMWTQSWAAVFKLLIFARRRGNTTTLGYSVAP